MIEHFFTSRSNDNFIGFNSFLKNNKSSFRFLIFSDFNRKFSIHKIINELLNYSFSNDSTSILNVGSFINGKNTTDDLFAYQEIIKASIIHDFKIIHLGEPKQWFNFYKGLISKKPFSDCCFITPKVDLKDDDNFLKQVLEFSPSHLSTFSLLATQAYLNEPKLLDFVQKEFYGNNVNLGTLRNNHKASETYVRNSDFVGIDCSSIKYGDFRSGKDQLPNGLNAEDVCQIAKYAGLSNQCDIVSLSGINQNSLENDITDYKLLAQIIWCYIEGVLMRVKESPSEQNHFLKFSVPLIESNTSINFHKSKITNRWWVEFNSNNQSKFIPCNYEDYINATKNELPDKWIEMMFVI